LFSEELKTAAQKSLPKYYMLKNHQMGGVCIDIIHAMEKEVPDIHFIGYRSFLPFKRLQKSLEKGDLDFFVGLKKTKKREKIYHFVDFPLYRLNYVIAVRADDPIQINSFEDIQKIQKGGNIILSIFGTAATRFLIKKGSVPIDDGAKDIEIALKKLMRRRGRFLFYHDLGLKGIIKKNHLEKKVKILPVVFLTYNHYLAFSHSVSLKTISKIEMALHQLDKKKILDNIYHKYGVSK
jgi:glutamate/aspartate transport system substrate-binding protein